MTILLLLFTVIGLVSGYKDETVVECLKSDGNFSVLSTLLTKAGLTSRLSTTGPFTILAPTDFAFGKVGLALLNSLQNDLSQLQKTLEYHVINGFLLVPMIHGSMSKTTIEGQEVTLSAHAGMLTVNNDSHLVGHGDMVCNNGVIQPIDKLLLPPVVEHLTITQILMRRDDKFNDLFLGFLLGGLTNLLHSVSTKVTVFAPVDHAFAVYRNSLLRPGQANATAIYQEVLKYHIVPGDRLTSSLNTGSLFTLHGTSLNITKTATGIMVNQAHITEANIGASNGVIHAIDSLLIPPEFIKNN